MKKPTFIWGAVILTVGGIIAKIIGAFYKIPLTNIIGSAGMGIYYLVFPLYNLLLVISCSGVSIAVTQLVAKSRANKSKSGETAYFCAGLIISLIFSAIFSILVFVFAKNIAYEQGNILSYLGFMAISPAIIFASLVTVIKGYFQGIENMIPSSLSMIAEQVVKMVVGLWLSFKLLPKGVEYAVFGSVLAVTISEFATLLLLSINYICNKKVEGRKFYNKSSNSHKFDDVILKSFKIIKKCATKPQKYYLHSCEKSVKLSTALKEVLAKAVPNTLLSLIMPLMSLIDSFLIVNLLIKSGYSQYTATSLYGISNGVVSALVSLPIIVTASLSTVIVPNISGLKHLHSTEKIAERVSFFVKITWIISLPMFVYFLIMSRQIISVLYNFNVSGVVNEFDFAHRLLMMSSITIVYNSMLGTLVSILQALNRSYKVFFIMLCSMAVRVGITIKLVQNIHLNVFGVVLGNVVFMSLCVAGCVVALKNELDLSESLIKSLIVPAVSVAVAGIFAYSIRVVFASINVWLLLFVSGVVLVVIYGLLIILLKCFKKSELKYIPFSKTK